MTRYVIGIAGGSASGKTTIAEKLYNYFKEDSVILSHDFYYKDLSHLSLEERNKVNFDHPKALETELMVEHIKKLKNGETISHPVYDFTTHTRKKEWQEMQSAKIIFVEGILIYTNSELCDLCNIKLFVDNDGDVRFIRRLERDLKDRGRTLDSVINQYLSTVKPMHDQFVEPSKAKADLIIPVGGHNDIAISMITDAIKKLIKN